MKKTYRVRKPIRMGEDIREPGDLAPELTTFRRVEDLVRSGFIEMSDCLDSELADALTYCPELAPSFGTTVIKESGTGPKVVKLKKG